MSNPSNARDIQELARESAATVRTYARIAGVLLLLSIIAGAFGEAYAPSTLVVSADAAATAKNIVGHDWLFRLSFASYLVEAVCDIALAFVLYVLLRPVHRDVALLAAFFGLVSTALFGAAELFYFGASLILGGANYLKAFTPEQLHALALLSLKFYGFGGGIFMVFYGTASVLRGYLIYRSGYLPRFLGVLMTLGGLGFIIKNFTLVLAPAYASDVLLLPLVLANVALMGWLLAMGIDLQKWAAKTSTSDGGR